MDGGLRSISAADALQALSQFLYVAIFVVVAWQAVRRPLRANVDIALLFGAVSLIVAVQWAAEVLRRPLPGLISTAAGALLMALPYLMLRLVEDFSTVPRWLMRAAEAGLALAALALVVWRPLPLAVTLLLVLYFCGLEIYTAVAFVREARRSSGVTRRRLEAVAAGTAFLGLAVLVAPLPVLAPQLAGVWAVISQVCALASGVAYFVGFAPPGVLRRAWQEPELRAFLGRAASLPRLPNTAAIVHALEAGAAASLGARDAGIRLWVGQEGVLRAWSRQDGERNGEHEGEPGTSGTTNDIRPGEFISGRAFAEGRAILTTNALADDPRHAAAYRAAGATSILAAPITAGAKRLGVLVVYGAHAPLFAEEDLVLVQLLADQAAVILESRALIDEAARVQAREEATRLKNDFLSAAAHDLKTPLTTVLAQAQLLQRRAERNPTAPMDTVGIERLVKEARRLNRLVVELLDASRLEQGGFLGPRERIDLVEIGRTVCHRPGEERQRCRMEESGPVTGEYDRARILQLVENLVDNAVKYSPEGGEVCVRIWQDEDEAHLTVSDSGIGIPANDLPHIFDRFYRGSNVDDRRFSGTGLGLYLCRAIVEEHGGRIWATSQLGRGSTFQVVLPRRATARGGPIPDAAAPDVRSAEQSAVGLSGTLGPSRPAV